MTNIYQLIPDIKHLVEKRDWFTPEVNTELTKEIATRMQSSFGERGFSPYLRLSKPIWHCDRALWFSVHHPELAEDLPAEAVIKFSYGHTIEAMALAMAKAAGHEVTGEQDELVACGIKGHRDCVLDGHIVDVKSCSVRQFEKIKRKQIGSNDDFGYLAQLDGYMVGSVDDPLVRSKDVAFIFAIEKEKGKMCLYEHHLRRSFITERLEHNKTVVASKLPPVCTCGEVKEGESGNLALNAPASYSAFKNQCFDGIHRPRLRAFLYSGGVKYLSRVRYVPSVPELIGGQWVNGI